MAPILAAWYSRPMGGGRAQRAVTLFVALLAWTSWADAQTEGAATSPRPKIPLHVDYDAPGNCPGQADFQAGVRARAESSLFTDEASAEKIVRITVRATGSSYAGHMSVVAREGTMSSRDVEDLLCTDVVEALALVTALAIDPTASAPPAITPAAAVPPSPPPPPLPALPVPASLSPSGGTSPSAPRPSLPRESLRWRPNVGVEADVRSGIASGGMLGGASSIELESRGGRVFRPSVRLSLEGDTSRAFSSPEASFTLLAARAELCPVRLGGERVSVRACGSGEVGDLLAKGRNVAHETTAGSAWVALGARVRARAAPWRKGPFFEVGATFDAPLHRPTFAYEDPYVRVQRASAVTGGAALGAGWSFW